MNRKRLSSNMKRMRRARNVTQAELAELCGMHVWTISSIEIGRRAVDRETLELFCRVLDWPIEELLWQTE